MTGNQTDKIPPPPPQSLKIQLLPSDSSNGDVQDAIHFTKSLFLQEEPITAALYNRNPAAAKLLYNTLTADSSSLSSSSSSGSPGVAVVLKDGTGKICGACLCDTWVNSHDPTPPQALAQPQMKEPIPHENPEVAAIVAFFNALKANFEALRAAKLLPGEPVPAKTLHIGTLGVDSAYRGLGLARKLLEVAFEEAQRQGYDDVVTEATSGSQFLLKKLGFCDLKYLKYDEFEYEGERPLERVEYPGAMLMWRRLNRGR